LRSAIAAADAALLVDFPEVNQRLLARARAPVAWLAPPQAWAWRPWRARAVARAAWVGCLLPFEADWYRDHGVEAEWVGHPLAEAPVPPPAAAPCVALLPGSRDGTVRRLLPVLLAAAVRLRRDRPRLRFSLAVASTVERLAVRRAVVASDLPIALHDDAPSALAEATVAVAGAGTATLQAALAGRPVVAVARLHPASAAVARRLVRVDHVALPNLVLGRRAFAECVQDDCTPEDIAAALDRALADPLGFSSDLAELRARMHRPGFAARAAERVLALL
jgi:lipid-A-disaccharide synthase